MKKLELLAPAGSMEALKAAVWAGADAVYFGGKVFNARAFAGNFEGEGMCEAMKLCRLYGVKVYITLNTLLSDGEIKKALAFVDEMEGAYPPDAYIVQDVGLVRTLKRRYPDLVIHASTQMQQHSADGAAILGELGISRTVLAREVTREDIAAVVASGIETEVFVHGAICVCQSGGCLMSSFIGGRSGNRGECAQPCRQRYNGGYPLSLKDMCLAGHIKELSALGVDCLKIEGRMKSAEYVYEVVSVYRALIDENRNATPKEQERLANAFSRSGFTDGYFTGKTGKNMFGIRTEADKEKSRSAAIDIRERKLSVNLECSVKRGAPCRITATMGEISVMAEGQAPDDAINRPLTVGELNTRLEKTGGTPFSARASSVVEEGLILPISAVNELRRSVLSRLSDAVVKANTPDVKGPREKGFEAAKSSSSLTDKKYLVARFEGGVPSAAVLAAAFRLCKRVEVPLWAELPAELDVDKLSPVLPRAVFPRDRDKVKGLIEKAIAKGIKQFTVSNFAHISLCEGCTLHGDYSLNVTNTETAEYLLSVGFSTVTVSPEIPSHYNGGGGGKEYMVYGRAPLMHTENCIIANVGGCKNEKLCRGWLKDKTGAAFPVIREYAHRNTIYNSVPCYLLDKTEGIKDVDGHIMLFTVESDREILEAFELYSKSKAPNGAFTRAAYKREGSVFRR